MTFACRGGMLSEHTHTHLPKRVILTPTLHTPCSHCADGLCQRRCYSLCTYSDLCLCLQVDLTAATHRPIEVSFNPSHMTTTHPLGRAEVTQIHFIFLSHTVCPVFLHSRKTARTGILLILVNKYRFCSLPLTSVVKHKVLLSDLSGKCGGGY